MRDDTAVAAADQTQLVRLWDLPLRIFHWALAACVAAAWGLGKFGPDIMTLHFLFGYAVIGLLAFRLLWGFVGPRPARFRSCFMVPGRCLPICGRCRRAAPATGPVTTPWAVCS